MTAIPEPTITIQSLIDKYHASKSDKFRPHLGCSLLGHPCERYLWLSFRWMVAPCFSGRMLRLFRRGQLEESTVISDLRAIGIDVQTMTTQQRVELGCHVSGSLDGIIKGGVPAAPKKKHVLEIKTSCESLFKDLVKNGVEKSKFQHFIQMQCYMYGSNIDRALYVCINKNDDTMHTERVKLDEEVAKKYIDRGHRIVKSDRMPPPISSDPTWYQCKMCHCHEFCHMTKKTKEANCRTCAHSTPLENSTWRCERHGADGIPVEFQRVGCESHVIHPDSVPWTREASQNPHMAVYLIDGKRIQNGEPDAHTFGSKELIGDINACLERHPVVMEARKDLGARIEASEEIPF